MRILFSKNSKKELLKYLKLKHSSNSLRCLSKKLNISKNTLDDWFYNPERYISNKIIPQELKDKLEVLDKKEDNWGNIKGGKKTYQIILKKYGFGEIKRRQSAGGRKSVLLSRAREEPFILDIKNNLFLEFYGILIGDGWIGEYCFKNKKIRLIGISGHFSLDRDFFMYCKKNIKKLFNRKAYFKEKPKTNSIELQIFHKSLFNALSKEINFPIGKKGEKLKIDDKIMYLGFDSLKHTIRGIFDTDGSFYLDKTPLGNPYPCISIQMKAPILINQLYNLLVNQGFRVVYREKKNMITLKGKRQLSKWMREVGSSNPKHLNKISAFVAQSGIRARPS